MKRIIGFCLYMALMISPLFCQEYIQVVKPTVNIRFGPSNSSAIIAQSISGNIYKLVGEKVEWYEISMFSGEYRYIYKSMCKKVNYSISLPENEVLRKEGFKAILNAEDRAQADADRKYPNDIMKNIDYQRMLDDKYKLEAINKHGLQPPIYSKLIMEGVKNKWID